MNNKRAIVLVSGGMDSLVTAAIANIENDEVYFLHIKYGQKTMKKEFVCFESICEYYKPAGSKCVDISYLKDFGGSSLISSSSEKFNSLVPTTYVPFRNGNLISIAASWAEVLGASGIYIGAIEVEGSDYPDCRLDFFKALENAINIGTKEDCKIKINTPLIHKTKADIVTLGIELYAPFEISWSCYFEDEIACGHCDSCILRLRAFEKNGLKDPIDYKDIN